MSICINLKCKIENACVLVSYFVALLFIMLDWLKCYDFIHLHMSHIVLILPNGHCFHISYDGYISFS